MATVVILVTLAGIPALASDPPEEPPGDGVSRLFKDIEKFGNKVQLEALKAQINLSPVLRQIVCRVAYQPFTKGELGRTLGVPDEDINKALEKLKDMKLVSLEIGGGGGLVISSGDEAQGIMKRWAEEWCVNEDSCGVAK